MKYLLVLISLFVFSCDSDDQTCYYNDRELYQGSQGGCYYWNSNGNKTYVDRSCCTNCDC